MRKLKEIQEEEYIAMMKVWYNRHQIRKEKVKAGKHPILDDDKAEAKNHHACTSKSIWKGALAGAKKLEKELGKKNLGPWSDFEWAMLLGRLETLRWVLGGDWEDFAT